jgi:hypothetical protein
MPDTDKRTKGAGTLLYSLMSDKSFDSESPTFTATDWDAYTSIVGLELPEVTAEEQAEDLFDNDEAEWNDYQSAAKDAGTLGATLQWNPGAAVQQQIIADFNAGTKKWWAIKHPNGFIDFYYGFISSLGKQTFIKEKVQRAIKIRNCGKPVLDSDHTAPAA